MPRLSIALAVLALASGCTPVSAEDFSNILPDDRLKINLPTDDTTGLRSNLGDVSEYYLFTAQVTTDVNGLIGQVLDAVEYITEFDPTWGDEEENTAVWGPWTDQGVEGYLAVHYEEAADTYDWGRDLPTVGETDDDWVTVFAGDVGAGATDTTGSGRMAIDFDAFSDFDTEGDDVTGVFYVEYDVTDETTTAHAGFEGFSENGGEATDVAYFYDQEHDEGGLMDLVFWADVTGNEVQEAHIERSRWHKAGDGRADGYITEGDFGALVYQATECWKQDHAVTFYEDNANLVTHGDEESCTFSEPAWNDSDDAPAL